MLRKIIPLLIFTILAGCESSSEQKTKESSQAIGFQLHANALQGSQNEVIALEKLDTLYHLFYSTGNDEWGHLVSQDLQNWQAQESMELQEGTDGALAINPPSESRLPATWNRLEQKEDKLYLFRSANGIDWDSYDENPVLQEVRGKIRVTWNPADQYWMMTETESEGLINIYTSRDWSNWTASSTLSVDMPVSRAAIVPLNNGWFLQMEGSSIGWIPLNQMNGAFVLTSDTTITEYHGIRTASIYQGKTETLLIASHADQNEWTSTFSLPMALDYTNETMEISQPGHLNSNLIGKRRGVLSKLKAEGPSQYTIRVPRFENNARLDVVADSIRIGSIFLDKYEKLIKWDRSLSPVGESQGLSFPWHTLEEPFTVDLIIDGNTYDLRINKGMNFNAVFHSGTRSPATLLRWFSDDEERDIPGAILTYQKRKHPK